MEIHHLIKSAYSSKTCIYCANKLDPDDWKSGFDMELHYKEVVCKCGKKNIIKVKFHGSGHDGWSKLEKKVNGETKIVKGGKADSKGKR